MSGENIFFSLREKFDFPFPVDRAADGYSHGCHVDAAMKTLKFN